MPQGGWKTYLTLYLIIPGSILAFLAIFFCTIYLNKSGPLTQEKDVIIEKGISVFKISETLWENGVIKHPDLFTAITFITRKNKKLKAGEYKFTVGISPREVLRKLSKGEVLIHSLTVPEGLTKYQVIKMINDHPVLIGDITAQVKEGELFPETYYFSRGYTRNELVERMKDDHKKIMFELWQKRAESLPLKTPDEAVVLASIVEKETGIESERGLVAGVFVNRLRKGMPLQSDPTALYVVSNKTGILDRALTRKDLEVKSPFNTYYIKGLPPEPIANPGRKSIEAVMRPDSTNYLYFVATGDGGHNFSETLDGHLDNVKEYKKALKSKN